MNTLENSIDNADSIGKPSQFKLMELFSPRKRNILSDLMKLKGAPNEESENDVGPGPEKAEAPEEEEPKSGRRFNPMGIIGKVAQKPMDMVLKKAIQKIFESYRDTSKPFGPTYDTTWGSGRKMDTDSQLPPDYAQMQNMYPQGGSGIPTTLQSPYGGAQVPNMLQAPPSGPRTPNMPYYAQNRPEMRAMAYLPGAGTDEPPIAIMAQPSQDGMPNMMQAPQNYYSSQMMSSMYGGQNQGQPYQYGQYGMKPYQPNYDPYTYGQYSSMSATPPGIFAYSPQTHLGADPYQSHQENRRANTHFDEIDDVPEDNSVESNGKNDDDEEHTEDNDNDDMLSDTQAEFDGAQDDVAVGNRRFAGNDDDKDDNIDKLVVSTFKHLGVIIGNLKSTLENGTSEQIGERFVKLYQVLKKNSYI